MIQCFHRILPRKESIPMTITDIHAHIFPHKLAEKASASIGGFYGTHAGHLASVEGTAENFV